VIPRIGVLGAGAWGANHVRVIASTDGCALHAVADRDAGVAERVRKLAPDARFVTDPDQVLSDPAIDAIVIATPAPTHAALAIAALEARKHVLIEKPLAMSLPDAHAVADAARRAERTVMVGHLMVHHPAVIRLRAMLRSGSLGTLHYLHSTRVNLGKIRRDENALWSFGPHDLSMFDFLLDRAPQTVSARGQSVVHPGIEDVVFLSLRYASGEVAHAHLSWLNPRKERRLTLVCSHKMAEFDDVATDKLRIYDKGYDRPPEFTEYAEYLTLRDGDVFIPTLPMQEPLRVQWQQFLANLAVPPALADLARAVRVTAVLEAAQRSLQGDGAPVEVEQVGDFARFPLT
jgi:predicted dehydrogenase